MSPSVPDSVRTELQLRLQALSELVAYVGHADNVNRDDASEWYRNILRALTDISEEASTAERYFSITALDSRSLSPTDIAKAARITRSALYKRRTVSES